MGQDGACEINHRVIDPFLCSELRGTGSEDGIDQPYPPSPAFWLQED